MQIQHLADFLEPVNLARVTEDADLKEGQMGRSIILFEDEWPDLSQADLVIASCDDMRGDGIIGDMKAGTNKIRKAFYSLFYWHKSIRIADIGHIKTGANITDTYAAIRTVASEVNKAGKYFLLLGGTQDMTLALYEVFRQSGRQVEVTGVDAFIDLSIDNPVKSKNFLMEMLTGDPNHIKHYNHIGFQSYFVHPKMLETMDQLRFDCYRLGRVKENIEEMEPVLRSTELLSFDLACLNAAVSPGNVSPNGFNGEEACTLMRHAGMSQMLKIAGIFGYNQHTDESGLLATQVAQMIWYYIDGIQFGRNEASLENKDMFIACHIAFAQVETTFIKSKKTGRWWMLMPDGRYVPCSYSDFQQAGENEIPERWLRIQERN
jgi:arginase family enzyme